MKKYMTSQRASEQSDYDPVEGVKFLSINKLFIIALEYFQKYHWIQHKRIQPTMTFVAHLTLHCCTLRALPTRTL